MDGKSPVVVGGRFFKVLVPGFETSLNLPGAFVKTLDTVDLNSKSSVLKSCKGSWNVDIKKRSDGSLHFFGENWETYVKDHQLKVGEFILFEHDGRLKFNTLVFDETSCLKDLEDVEDNNEDDVLCLEEIDGEEEVPPSGSKQNVNSQFQITLTNSKLEGYVYVPKAFATSNGISEEGTVTLRNGAGDSWQAKLNVYIEYKGKGACHNRFCLRGLSKFFKGNKLKVGDICIFEFDHYSTNSKHVVMNVLFVRKG